MKFYHCGLSMDCQLSAGYRIQATVYVHSLRVTHPMATLEKACFGEVITLLHELNTISS